MSTEGNGRTTCTDCGLPLWASDSRADNILGLCHDCAAEPPLAIQCANTRCNAEIASGDRLDAQDEGWIYYREPGEWACRDCCSDFERTRGS